VGRAPLFLGLFGNGLQGGEKKKLDFFDISDNIKYEESSIAAILGPPFALRAGRLFYLFIVYYYTHFSPYSQPHASRFWAKIFEKPRLSLLAVFMSGAIPGFSSLLPCRLLPLFEVLF
jgi:hypothetical protein